MDPETTGTPTETLVRRAGLLARNLARDWRD